MVDLKISRNKLLKIENSNFQKSPTQFSDEHWDKFQDKFENLWLRFRVGGV